MDEIATDMGISKKTIYAHFSTKTELIEATTNYMFDNISTGINKIRRENKNAIEEHFAIKNFVRDNLRDEKSSPQHQLQKYYPKIYAGITHKQKQLMEEIVKENLAKGIAQGHYRKDIPVDFICRIYFVEMLGIKNRDLFPEDEFSSVRLVDEQLEYHLRAIVTQEGLETLTNYLQINK